MCLVEKRASQSRTRMSLPLVYHFVNYNCNVGAAARVSCGGSSVATFCNSNDFVYYLGDYFSLLSRLWKCILGPFSINIQKRAKKKDFLAKEKEISIGKH